MSYIAVKRIKGREYYYLIKSGKVLKSFGNTRPSELEITLADHNLQKAPKTKHTNNSRLLKLRFLVLARDNFTCRYCGRNATQTELQIDHIIPKSKGGKNELSNYITSCRECNIGKNDALLLAHKNKKLSFHGEGQIPSFMTLSI